MKTDKGSSGRRTGEPRQPDLKGGEAPAARELALELLVEADWNANRVSAAVRRKLRRSLEQFGLVENLVARPHPRLAGRFEILSGNQRLGLLRELGYAAAPVVVVELDDARARLLAQALNRTRGSDDPVAQTALLERVLAELSVEEVAGVLPEAPARLERVLREFGSDPADTAACLAPPGPPRTRPGELVELGPHRLLCGDATNAGDVARLFGGERAALLVADPPYGVGVDHRWRDGLRQPLGSARQATLLNDDRCDWREAYELAPAPVAYVWHSALHGGVVAAGLEAAGFRIRQQLVWVKRVHALSRSDYQWAHEPCWYAVRRGARARWRGDRKQTTVWEAASPIAPFGRRGGPDEATAHPTQKPLELYERPLLNHTDPGEILYDPFAGSGTCLVAAQKHGRRCLAIELDPAWCDLIRERYAALTGGG